MIAADGPTFTVTVLRSVGRKRPVKLFTDDGRKLGTEKAAKFVCEPLECHGARDFFAKMSGLDRRRDCCIIRAGRGRWFPADGGAVFRLSDPQLAYMDNAGDGPRVLPDKVKQYKRDAEVDDTLLGTVFLPMFEEQGTAWVLLDYDKVQGEPDWRSDLPGTAMWLRDRLPEPFHGASCWYQATGSAADLTKPDLGGAAVCMRLGFGLDRLPITHKWRLRWPHRA